jgi:hypothetical protein
MWEIFAHGWRGVGCFLKCKCRRPPNLFGKFLQVLYEIQVKFRLKFLLVHYEIQGKINLFWLKMRELTRESHHHIVDPYPSLPSEADTHPLAKGWKFEHTSF